jgi:hypothetical protein
MNSRRTKQDNTVNREFRNTHEILRKRKFSNERVRKVLLLTVATWMPVYNVTKTK